MTDSTIEQNLLNKTRFKMSVARAPNFEFFVTRTNIPDINLPPARQPTPIITVPQWGDHLEFGQLNIEFNVQENLANYLEIYYWLTGLGRLPDSKLFAQLKASDKILQKGLKSDIVVSLLDASYNPVMNITYKDAFPCHLSVGELNAQTQDAVYATGSAVFLYSYFTFDPVIN